MKEYHIDSKIYTTKSKKNENFYILIIYGIYNIWLFYKNIGTIHKHKKARIEKLIKSSKKLKRILDFEEIIKKCKAGKSYKEIANKFDISKSTVSRILNNKYIDKE